MYAYINLLSDVLEDGREKDDRTGTGTLSVFGRQLRFDLGNGFPLITTKRLHLKSIIHELLWFISGNTNIRYLKDNGVSIWDEWADENGELGEVYGKQWRAWRTSEGATVDQLTNVVNLIKSDPNSRRLLVNAWNVGSIDQMALPPCHYAFQFYVCDRRLSCMFNMRSVDVFLGLPFNIASYSLLTHMVAQQCDLTPGEVIWNGGDVHLYRNHQTQAEQQKTRRPYPLPTLRIGRKPKSIEDYRFEDFELLNYKAHPHIPATIAV